MSRDGSLWMCRVGARRDAAVRWIRSRRKVLYGAAALALIVAAAAWVRYLHSPGYVVDATLRALDSRDTEALLRLASPYEKRVLNLTPQSVEAFLRETWWRDPAVRPRFRVTERIAYYANVLAYGGDLWGFEPGGGPEKMVFEVYRDKQRVWRLALSRLLSVSVQVCVTPEGNSDRMLEDLLRRSGVRAVVSPSGGTTYADGTHAPVIRLPGR